MPTIYMTKGLPASGKTTWAKKTQRQYPNCVNVNKDDLRAMLHDGSHSKVKEKQVLDVRDYIVRLSLGAGKNVIVSDTNLNPVHEENLRKIAKEQKSNFEIVDFTHVPLKTCIERDSNRENPVGEKVIRGMYNQYLRTEPKYVGYNIELPNCYIIDIDGTVAWMKGRSPYDWHRVSEDEPNPYMIRVLESLFNSQNDCTFIFLSGRDGVCQEETTNWLYDHIMESYDDDISWVLYMRAEKDQRKDSVVKRELYEEHIKGKYNVLGVFDDRNQVVEMWRELGLPCFQVAEGDF